MPHLRDATVNRAYALGFAGMGFSQPGKVTPLRLLLESAQSEYSQKSKRKT
jgi:hypothetical protein